jgi:hypothetical protein
VELLKLLMEPKVKVFVRVVRIGREPEEALRKLAGRADRLARRKRVVEAILRRVEGAEIWS